MAQWGSIPHLLQSVKINPRRRKWLSRQRGTILILYRKDMEYFNKLVPIDGENGEKRTISSLQIAEITGKAYCGVLKVIRKMDIMCVKITMKNIFSLFVCLKKCCNFAVSNIFKGRWLSAHSRHFLCLYIIATKILRLLPPCGEVNALPTAFEVCSTTGKDSRFSVYNAKNVE